MIAANGTWASDVDYAPFGGTAYLYYQSGGHERSLPRAIVPARNGLADNWHRHYDPTLGRYDQPDPLIVDEDDAAVAGISKATLPGGSNTGNAPALAAGWKSDADFMTAYNAVRPMLQDGSSVYGYAGQSPLALTDPWGLGTRTEGDPWTSVQVDRNRWRFFDGNGCADFDIELPGDHLPGPAWHPWNRGKPGPESPF